MRARVLLISFLLFVGLGLSAHAQFGTDPLTISIYPEYPRPYQIVTVTPASTLIDLSASTVTFSVNGAVVQRGTGTESASVAVGGPGSVTTITVTAVENGQTYTKQVSIRPADVALVLEPISTTHPFYGGAPLIASEGRLRLIAVPDLRTSAGAPLSSANLVYTWRNGEQILQSSSGIGKSVLTATAPVRYRDTVISVTVTSQDSAVVGYASTRVAPTDPILRIYESDPLLGPRFDTALSGNVLITDSEKTYRTVPYYFAAAPSLTWEVNGVASQTGQDITVRPSGNGKGTALLGVGAVVNSSRQSAKTSLSVTFGAQRTGIFGF